MQVTFRIRSAVAALVEIASFSGSDPTPLREIASRKNISLSYLEPIFSIFCKSGLVASTKGPGGGYRFAKDSSEIKIADILRILNEDIYVTPVGIRDDLPPYSLTANIWISMNQIAIEFLESVTLASLIVKDQATKKPNVFKVTAATGVKELSIRPVLASNVPNSVFALGLITSR